MKGEIKPFRKTVQLELMDSNRYLLQNNPDWDLKTSHLLLSGGYGNTLFVFITQGYVHTWSRASDGQTQLLEVCN